ncbi:unnamed protein product [Discosporangium mesarthrocarpum]
MKDQLRSLRDHVGQLQDQIFCLQTGAPHRELLGEMWVGQQECERQGRTNHSGTRCDGAGKQGHHTNGSDLKGSSVGRDGCYLLQQRDQERVSELHSQRSIRCINMKSLDEELPRPLSLRTYLSSLRPFSACGGNSDWGWAARVTRERKKEDSAPPWPVLFNLGDHKLPNRDPMAISTLPPFDSEGIARLARAIGESARGVRAMVLAITQFDCCRLHMALMLLCLGLNGEVPTARYGEILHNKDLAQAKNGRPSPGSHRAASKSGGRNGVHECKGTTLTNADLKALPAIISEETACNILRSDFLKGVFSAQNITEIISASRPVVLFDSEKVLEEQVGVPCSQEPDAERTPATQRNHNQNSLQEHLGKDKGVESNTLNIRGTTVHDVRPKSNLNPEEASTGGKHVPEVANGVLVDQLLQVVTVKLRLHCAAVYRSRSLQGGMQCTPGQNMAWRAVEQQGKWAVGSDITTCQALDSLMDIPTRPSSALSEELGLPPLKLVRSIKQKDPGRKEDDAHKDEEAGSVDLLLQPRLTPRLLRPGFEGKVTAAMLREELEASQNAAARIGFSMARKAEVWCGESSDLAQESTQAQATLAKAALSRMNGAVGRLYLGNLRHAWTRWTVFLHHKRSHEVAGRLVRAVGAAAIGFSVMEPLLRRKQKRSLLCWAANMRAERVIEVQAAALEIQRIIRGMLGRKRACWVQRGLSAVTIQRLVRAHSGRMRARRRARFLEERAAVMTIETKYMEFCWQRTIARVKLKEKRQRAATKIQAAWRGLVLGRRVAYVLRENHRRSVSALMIQRLWRGVLVRVQADILLEEKQQKEAAVKIQAVARGRGARDAMLPHVLRYRAACCLGRAYRCYAARMRAQRKRQEVRLSQLLNPLVRGFLGRIVAKRAHAGYFEKQRRVWIATLAAQKFFRGKKGRLKARRQLMRKIAAVELQRLGRGHMGRRHAYILSEKRKAGLIKQEAMWSIAIAIQCLWRGMQGRKIVIQVKQMGREKEASITISSAIKHYIMLKRAKERQIGLKEDASSSNAKHDDRDGEFAQGPDSKNNQSDSEENESPIAGGDDTVEGQKIVFAHTGNINMFAPGFASSTMPSEVTNTDANPRLTSPIRGSGETGANWEDMGPREVNYEEDTAYYQMKVQYMRAQDSAHGSFARKIQSSLRAFLAQKRVARMREERKAKEALEEGQHKAAIALQACARGHQARRKARAQGRERVLAKKMDESSVVMQCAVRCFLAKGCLRKLKEEEGQKQLEQHLMASRIQA